MNGKVILLLHGFPDCWYSWRYQIPVLSTNYRVIALDMKGFNDSDKPLLRYSYRPSIICFELKMFLDALEIKTVNIIGHDLGGLVGWFFALTYPSYVDKIVQIASPHPNFYWELSKTALTTKNWCNMVQVSVKYINYLFTHTFHDTPLATLIFYLLLDFSCLFCQRTS